MASGLDKIKAKLGVNIRKYREQLGFTQLRLSVRIGVTEQYINMLETGKRTPTMAVLGKLADTLKVEPYKLIE